MLKFRKRCYCILLMSLFLTPCVFATFNDIGVGARPLGFGGAFVALADDNNAPHYNPAGLGYIDEIQVGGTYAQRFNGQVTYNMISGILPLGQVGTIGADIGILTEASEIYREQLARFSYGNALFDKVAIGVNLKRFGTAFDETNEFVKENPYFARTAASAFSVDIGILAKPVQGLSLGLSAENLVDANLSISESYTDSVPRNIRAGLVYSFDSIAEMSAQGETVSKLLKGSLVTIEVAFRNGDIYTRTGIETWVNKNIAVRGGYSMKNRGTPATTLSFGGSLKFAISSAALQLDYGFQLLTGDLQDNTTQRFSVNLLF